MHPGLVVKLACAALSLIGASGVAVADPIGRYECTIVGALSPEPLGDCNGHSLLSYQYSCFGVDGLLKGATYTANLIQEWDGPDGKFLLAGGVHRVAGGLAVTELLEGAALVVMKDDKPVGVTSSGKAIFKLASGPLAALAGKTVKFATNPASFNHFTLELAE
jgi:hypothetical protein